MGKMTRRGFVGASVTGAAGLATQPGALAGPQPAKPGSANNRVLLALIGAGGRGMDVIRQMVRLPDVAVKYVCDA
jgi:hypothetical protein